MTKQNDNETAMIASILAGDTRLYHDLIRPHERSVYMMAISFVKNEADAEDIAQDAFVKAFRNLSTFRAESKFSTWLKDAVSSEINSTCMNSRKVRFSATSNCSLPSVRSIEEFLPRLDLRA